MQVNFAGERIGFQDMLQRLYSDDGAGDGRITPRGLKWLDQIESLPGGFVTDAAGQRVPPPANPLLTIGGPALAGVMLGRRELAAEYDRVMDMNEAESATPLWLRGDSQVERQIEEWAASPLQRARRLPLVLMLPALNRATINAQMAMLRRDVALTIIALELHRRKHGDWPRMLDELVPAILPAVPRDRFDGQPLRYVMRDGAPMLYSVGSDREDDGGVLPPLANPNGTLGQFYAQQWLSPAQAKERRERTTVLSDGRTVNEWDGDWILWPPLPPEPLVRRDDP